MKGKEQGFKISKVIKHPNYRKNGTLGYDFALLTLDKPATLNR